MMNGGRSFSGRERNCCFLNTGAARRAESRFANISAVSGLDYPDDGRAVALVDWDHDGDLDMWISNRNAPRLRLMRNQLPQGNHFLALRLQGNGVTTNRDAIGARVEVVLREAKGKGRGVKGDSDPASRISHPASRIPLIKTLRAGEGFLAQSSKWLHFGLGAAEEIDTVIVHWPGGQVEHFTGIDVDHRYRLVQGSQAAREISLPRRETKLVPSTQKVQPSTQVARVPLVEVLAMPDSNYIGLDGQQHQLRQHRLPGKAGRLTLLNLWASWCAPCLAELSEFSQRHEELQAKGIDIVALSVDGLGDDRSSKEDAARLVSQRKFPFSMGYATSSLINDLQQLHNLHIPLHLQLPLPSSFLIDRQGRLAVIYKGPVSVDQLLKDLNHSDGSRLDRFLRAAPLAGRTIGHPQVERSAVNSAVSVRFLLADSLQRSGRARPAALLYAEVLKLRPDSYRAHADLGSALQEQGKLTEAIEHHQQALQINPEYAAAHNNLGLAFQEQGKIEAAIEQYRQALQLNADYDSAHYNMGNVLLGQRKLAAAIEHYQRALEIKPEFAQAHSNLGVALQQQGKLVEAIKHYRRAVQIKPDYPQAHNNLGVALYTLAGAYAKAGQFDKAIELASHAIDAASAAGNEKLAQTIRGQVVLYRQGLPYRE